jgi:hypothetical protein
MRLIAQTQSPRTDSAPQTIDVPAWTTNGITVAAVLAAIAYAIRQIPSLIDKKWSEAAAERKADREHDEKLRAEDRQLINMFITKSLNDNATSKEDFSHALTAIANVVQLQGEMYRSISEGFVESTKNQAKQIQLLEAIADALRK